MRTIWRYAFALGAAVLAGGAAQAGDDPAKGREAALKWCSRCHVVGDHDPYGGIDSTPWFPTFAAQPGIYPPAHIRTFNERPPHPPQDIRISGSEMDDLMAYVESLAAD